ncbi:MAG: flagellar FlbD family protein [Acidimicrobiales bacterium]
MKKLDGSTMHLNEDLVERVEPGVEGQSAVYLRDGAHFIVANPPESVVDMIRAEKTELLRRAFLGEGPETTPLGPATRANLTKLTQVRGS